MTICCHIFCDSCQKFTTKTWRKFWKCPGILSVWKVGTPTEKKRKYMFVFFFFTNQFRCFLIIFKIFESEDSNRLNFFYLFLLFLLWICFSPQYFIIEDVVNHIFQGWKVQTETIGWFDITQGYYKYKWVFYFTPKFTLVLSTLKFISAMFYFHRTFLHCFILVSRFVKEDRLPHLLFYGPPGTGKTSTILAVAKQIYSPKEFNSMVLEVYQMMS